jgi:Plavaka transposase
MSASDIDTLLNLWNASAAASGESAPLQNHKHMYDTIDATPLGDIPWESFSLHFNGNRPDSEVPSWMDASYNVWFHEPHQLVHNIISNPDFENGFDYTPYQEHDADGSCHYHNFMSANWPWKQAVCNINELVFYLIHN